MFNRIKETIMKNENRILCSMCMAPNMMMNPESIKAIVEYQRAIEETLR